MVQTKGSFDLSEMRDPLKGSVFVPELQGYKGPTEYSISGEFEIPIELELLVKYPFLR